MADHDLDVELLSKFDESAHPEISAMADAAAVAARETFGPFMDEEDSPYYEAEDHSPASTWERVAERVGSVTARAVLLALAMEPITPGTISDFHRRIFGDYFPESAGNFRNEAGQYGILLGTREDPRPTTVLGAAPRNIGAQLAVACDVFNDKVAAFDGEDEPALTDLVAPPARLYAKVLRIHPFIDGNGRMAHVMLQYALVRSYLLAVPMTAYEEHQWALSVAIRNDSKQSYIELERLLADTISKASA